MFGKSSVDISHLIECDVEIDWACFRPATRSSAIGATSGYFVQKAKTNLPYLQEEIKEDFKKGANRTKQLHRNSGEKDGDIENINEPIEPSTALQVQQRSAAKSLKFEQFLTTSTSFNAENHRTIGDRYDILTGSTYNVARKNSSRFKVRCLDREVHCDWSN